MSDRTEQEYLIRDAGGRGLRDGLPIPDGGDLILIQSDALPKNACRLGFDCEKPCPGITAVMISTATILLTVRIMAIGCRQCMPLWHDLAALVAWEA